MTFIQEKKQVPTFSLESTGGQTITSKGLKGQAYILFFYPKDNTPGCTKEVCSFRDHFKALQDKNFQLYGISPDTIASHARFIAKQALPFELLSDPDHKTAQAFGAWGEKKMFGKAYMGIIRSTFIIDKTGKILKVYPKVKVASHAADILEDLKALDSKTS